MDRQTAFFSFLFLKKRKKERNALHGTSSACHKPEALILIFYFLHLDTLSGTITAVKPCTPPHSDELRTSLETLNIPLSFLVFSTQQRPAWCAGRNALSFAGPKGPIYSQRKKEEEEKRKERKEKPYSHNLHCPHLAHHLPSLTTNLQLL